jgi:hypothetical protein
MNMNKKFTGFWRWRSTLCVIIPINCTHRPCIFTPLLFGSSASVTRWQVGGLKGPLGKSRTCTKFNMRGRVVRVWDQLSRAGCHRPTCHLMTEGEPASRMLWVEDIRSTDEILHALFLWDPFGLKTWNEGTPGIPRRKWEVEDNNNVWRTIVNTVMKLRVSLKAAYFFTPERLSASYCHPRLSTHKWELKVLHVLLLITDRTTLC